MFCNTIKQNILKQTAGFDYYLYNLHLYFSVLRNSPRVIRDDLFNTQIELYEYI